MCYEQRTIEGITGYYRRADRRGWETTRAPQRNSCLERVGKESGNTEKALDVYSSTACLDSQCDHIAEIDPSVESRLMSALKLKCLTENEANVWDLADSLKEVLPLIADDSLLYQLLLKEKGRDPNKVLPILKEDLTKLLGGFDLGQRTFKDGSKQEAVDRLSQIYAARSDFSRHVRARSSTKARYLGFATITLFLLLVLLGFVSSYTHGAFFDWKHLGAIVFAGGVGASLSRALKLRSISQITELRGVVSTLGPQILIGGTIAVVVCLILRSEIITIKGIEFTNGLFHNFIIVSFLSGFSEPFALGIIDKVAGLGENGRDDSQNTAAAPPSATSSSTES